jgi:predicted O-linked N-acetylglucosamine transferase (SPINDLY family)
MNPATELRKASQLQRQGRAAEAVPLYRAVLARYPQHEDANLGLLGGLEGLEAWDELEVVARGMTEAMPRFLPAWLVLARVLLVRNQDALAVCQRCVQLAPRNPGAQDYLGIACRRVGLLEQAAAALQASLQLRPGHLSTQANLANVWRELGRWPEALRLYEAVLQVEPGKLDVAQAPRFAEAHNALGAVLQAMNRLPEAEVAFRTAVALQPDMPDAVANLVLVLHNLGKLQEMRGHLGRAVALAPASSRVRLIELVAALPKVLCDSQEGLDSLARFDAGLAAYADWRAAALRDASLRQDTLASLPFYLAYRPGNHRDRLARFADVTSQGRRWARAPGAPAARRPGGAISLGIVSAHIRRHSVWDIVLKGLIQHLDRDAFELTIYHLGPLEDEETRFARSAAAQWRDAASLTGHQGWADLIAADGQDALYYPEIGMHPGCYELAQQRLAPLQAAGWGHPVTTGIAAMDLFFSGELIEPPDGQDHYRETLVRLPGTGCCTTAFEGAAAPSPALAEALAASPGPSFLIAQSVVKFDPEFDTLLPEIAWRVGPCRFLIPVADAMQEPAQLLAARLSQAFAHAGLDAARHLAFLPWLGEAEFRHALQACTVFLDCPAFSGYTTAWKALREGIPVVTWEGPFMRQRLAAGLLRKTGLHELVATSPGEYVDKAVALATEPGPDRQARRARIAGAAPLADQDVSVVRAFELELRQRLAPAAQR